MEGAFMHNLAIAEHCERARFYAIRKQLGEDFFLKYPMLIANVELTLKNPAMIGQELEIRSRVEEVKNSSCAWLQEVYYNETLIGTVRVWYVLFDPKTKAPAPIPEELRAALSLIQ
jgi:acyl-CoA thioesterase FadM